LPERQKTDIILAKTEDRPQKEVAEITEINIKAVESLINRAKQIIERKLKDKDVSHLKKYADNNEIASPN
jgi:RNA polymerase sigma-70 factor, ECF subfamily